MTAKQHLATAPGPAGTNSARRGGSPASPSARRVWSRKAAARGWLAWWRADRGSVAAEVTLMAPLLILLLVFVAVVIHRGVDARLRVNDAAHQAARAASIERSGPAAVTAARSAAASALAAAGVACQSLGVETATGGLVPGGTVTVTVWCTVDFSDALLLGVADQKRLSATANEPVDTWRSITVNTAGGGR
ncbi:pilus assembly protein TadE [Solihabitans fulvus]|uniref:Pilus assembly protein TadE n=1 Tax=Solihabitans fulvus TaxID=1892852 RepID=A0A5B2WTV2_9PSEU|nr:TadE/TadG family type IV pilus assembly protein [Solihabitans fulvus]KAA2253307.1 pilus assembly protein TadE [Solihabitans fulvus]